jgi:hypothetical protein
VFRSERRRAYLEWCSAVNGDARTSNGVPQ